MKFRIKGQGWKSIPGSLIHSHTRHVNASKFGKAGGLYAKDLKDDTTLKAFTKFNPFMSPTPHLIKPADDTTYDKMSKLKQYNVRLEDKPLGTKYEQIVFAENKDRAERIARKKFGDNVAYVYRGGEFLVAKDEKTPRFIQTVAGKGFFVRTEIEDEYGKWNDSYLTKDGYWVIHEGKKHHVYRIYQFPMKHRLTAKKLDFLDKSVLTESEIKLLKRRLNDGKITFKDIFGEPDTSTGDTKVFRLTPELTKKGLDWLMNKWKTPRGIERKNNPFGYREQNVLENFSHFELSDFHDNVNYYQAQSGIKNFVPLWRVRGKDGSGFEYYVEGGEPQIVG